MTVILQHMAVACAAATTAVRRAQYRVLLYIDELYLHKYTSEEKAGARGETISTRFAPCALRRRN